MKIIGLLCFYDEPAENLVACITSLKQAGVESLVAIDGAYALYPEGKPASHPNQHAAIHLTCRQLGMSCVLHVPAQLWQRNEIEKRTFHFKLALSVAETDDWFWVMDADQIVKKVPDDLKQRLAAAEQDVGEVEFLDVVALAAKQQDWPPYFAIRNLFRAQEITVGPAHCNYLTCDGRVLWGMLRNKTEEPALDLTDEVLVEHRPNKRPTERQYAKLGYYAERDASLVERGTCLKCGAPSLHLIPTDWRLTPIGPVADWMEACDLCAAKQRKMNTARLRYLGIDPASLRVENRNGRPPDGLMAQAASMNGVDVLPRLPD